MQKSAVPWIFLVGGPTVGKTSLLRYEQKGGLNHEDVAGGYPFVAIGSAKAVPDLAYDPDSLAAWYEGEALGFPGQPLSYPFNRLLRGSDAHASLGPAFARLEKKAALLPLLGYRACGTMGQSVVMLTSHPDTSFLRAAAGILAPRLERDVREISGSAFFWREDDAEIRSLMLERDGSAPPLDLIKRWRTTAMREAFEKGYSVFLLRSEEHLADVISLGYADGVLQFTWASDALRLRLQHARPV